MDKRKINIPWLFEMAWRDSRRNRSRLMLFISAIIFGIAALVAIYSFRYNLENDINSQAASLIGADLAVSSAKPADASIKPLLDSLGDKRSEERTFVSMIYFPKSKGTRLVQVHALQGGFPYYGGFETVPVAAGTAFKTGKEALVDKVLMLQYNVNVGDSIKVGEITFLIAGTLNKAPGQAGISSNIAPTVYIPMQYLGQTGLSKKGSRITYSYYYKYDHPVDMKKLVKNIDPRLDKADMNYETIELRKENTGRSFGDLTHFLSLVGFIALLLGCVGVASAIHIYIREKIASIAIMRCLGVKGFEAFLIYLIQIVSIGIIGSVVGAFAGTFVQHILPVIMKDFLPFDITTTISWLAIGQGILLGVIISILFALLPLISIRNISPLNTLRISYEEINLVRDPLRWLVYGLILLFVTTFTYFQLDSWVASIFFTIGIGIAFLILVFVAWLLMKVMRLVIQNSWSYLLRQGFANLYRPNNQTIILIVSIGLSTAFICTLFFIQAMLMKQVSLSSGANQANMILFDIQNNQKKAVADLTRQQKLPVIQQVPIVTIRLDKINGKTAEDVKKDPKSQISKHAFSYEYRVTYRDTLTPSEKIVSGQWIGKADANKEIPVSIEQFFSKRNHVNVGDHLVFNVQGLSMPAVVASVRQVNWNKVQTNFQIVFPTGVLEEAPQFDVELTHVPSVKASAKFQQAVVRAFPNVSVIDIGQVISIIDDLLNKIGYIIRFMSAFSIITGVVVLIASVRISKYQRIQESVLLRTLGASRKQIFAITALEYLFLGALSALTGILIAVTGSWLLAKYSFEIPFAINIWPVLALFFIIALLTLVIGLLNSSGVLNKPPLEILRTT
ncbi:FtsX-like permease family protein [uncultured Mucilaginibacter sp.]|uniref:ABC transporter permease n=1 Tax=uncultured Mucilaginibacter sp. TaxID=797541 RepID=UPI0025EBA431|nr:FtsX-like permease family protein [uncultured Mucilaginibacter sp.]